jgi:hypothetical protein
MPEDATSGSAARSLADNSEDRDPWSGNAGEATLYAASWAATDTMHVPGVDAAVQIGVFGG